MLEWIVYYIFASAVNGGARNKKPGRDRPCPVGYLMALQPFALRLHVPARFGTGKAPDVTVYVSQRVVQFHLVAACGAVGKVVPDVVRKQVAVNADRRRLLVAPQGESRACHAHAQGVRRSATDQVKRLDCDSYLTSTLFRR